ncbi:MAG: glycosyltransferase [Anaerolineae bacterium]
MIIVILPAYNEEEALPSLLRSLAEVQQKILFDMVVIVIDDGSRDQTAKVVSHLADDYPWLSLVQHEQNQGLSRAIQTGFKLALEQAKSEDVIVTLDADNTQPPDRIPLMIERIEAGSDVVIASRFQSGAKVFGVSYLRRLYSFVMSVLFRVMVGLPGVRDYSCGFRAYRASSLSRAYDRYGTRFITEEGFACMVEILLKLGRMGSVRFSEVPFILHYEYKPTPTKMRVGSTIVDTLRLVLRYRFGSFG